MVNLNTEIGGLKLKNPFIAGSSHNTTAAGLRRAAKEGWAAGITSGGRTTGLGGGTVSGYIMREIKFVDKPPALFGYENAARLEGMTKYGLSLVPKNIEDTLKQLEGIGMPVGVNLNGGADPKPFVDQAIAGEKAGASFVEVNLSVPHVPGIGVAVFGGHPERVKPVIKAVKENCGLPLFAKINGQPYREALIELASAAAEGGADALTVMNTFQGIIGVDIETGMPLSLDVDINGRPRGSIHGISGPILKPFGLRAVAELYQAVKLPIVGVGGITTWESAVEYMMIGAKAVQIAAGVMLYGWRIVREMIRGLEGFMERKGYASVDDFVGMTTRKYGMGEPPTFLDVKQPRKMIVDETICDGCGRCVPACEASAKGAIQIKDGVAIIEQGLCELCNSCKNVCPTGAISVRWNAGVLG